MNGLARCRLSSQEPDDVSDKWFAIRCARRPRAESLVITVGGPPGRLRASLSIRGESLDPDHVTTMLGCQPDTAFRKGDLHKGRYPARLGMWGVEVAGAQHQSTAEVVDALLARLHATPDVWDALAQTFDISFNLMVGLAGQNNDVVLSAPQIARLAAMRASLWVDIYADGD